MNDIEVLLREKLGPTYVKAAMRYYDDAAHNYLTSDYEDSAIKAGKFVEAILKGLHFYTTKEKLRKIGVGNVIDMLMNLSKNDFHESVRLLIPRTCRVIYNIASDRGARHDVTGFDPSRMDAEYCLVGCSYIISELVRLFHTPMVTQDEAMLFAEELMSRRIPVVYEVNELKRVLNPSLKYKDQVLLLLHSAYTKKVAIRDLREWTEYKNSSQFIANVIRPLHKARRIEYDGECATILPPGIKEAEEIIRNSC